MYILSRNKRLVNKINEACKEGLIIILDATGTSLGDVINLYAHGNLQNRSNNKVISLSLHKVINKAVDMMGNILQPRTPILFLTQTSGILILVGEFLPSQLGYLILS